MLTSRRLGQPQMFNGLTSSGSLKTSKMWANWKPDWLSSWWWNQPIWKILHIYIYIYHSQNGFIFPKVRGENQKCWKPPPTSSCRSKSLVQVTQGCDLQNVLQGFIQLSFLSSTLHYPVTTKRFQKEWWSANSYIHIPCYHLWPVENVLQGVV